MNKTVNINLANTLFHMDEEAYNKMRRYLESIKRSFANTSGSDEILADIEARIAELFYEKLENERQVITIKEVDEVITIMGQPEDYMVDEDIFDDEPKSKKSAQTTRVKKLYRDTSTKYVAGVSAGLGHYLGIDALWVRLLWIFLTIFSWGGFILIYGLLWLLIPEALTTAQKLDMQGEAVNISNIEKKVKEGFDDVAEKVKSVDYEKVGNKVKNGGKTFFETLGDIIMFFFKVIGKFIGVILIIVGAVVVIGLFIGLLIRSLNFIHIPGMDDFIQNPVHAPVWLTSMIVFFAIGIPFFFLLYLGLKILVTNLKSIGNIAKFSLLGLWIVAIIGGIIIGVKEASAHAYSGTVTTENELIVDNPMDTLNINLVSSRYKENRGIMRMNHIIMTHNDDGEEVLLSEDVRIRIKRSKDSIIKMEIRKEANGPSFSEARDNADAIEYTYKVNGNTITLNDFSIIPDANKLQDLEVKATLYIPMNTVLKYESLSSRCYTIRTKNDHNLNGCDLQKYSWKMSSNGELKCLDCPEHEAEFKNDNDKVIINSEGINININENGENNKIKIDKNGVDIDINENGESFKMKINEEGVKVKTDNK